MGEDRAAAAQGHAAAGIAVERLRTAEKGARPGDHHRNVRRQGVVDPLERPPG